MKFLTDSKYNEQIQDNTSNILTQLTTQNNNKHNTINPNNVKLLTDDNAGIDFLTLCAVKKSEKEMSSEVEPKMDTTYIPAPKPIKDLFNFVVPDIDIINCISLLTEDNLTQCKDEDNNLPMQSKDNEDKNIYDTNDCIIVDDDNFWCTIRNERNADNNKIRFEDILDESSDSNETAVSYLNQRITDIEIDSINTNEASTSDMKEDNKIITSKKTELLNNTLEDLEPTIFENILNESFSSDEDDLKDKDDIALRSNTEPPHSSNIFTKIAEEINVTHETNITDTFHNKDNIAKTNQNLSTSIKLPRPQQMNKFVSFIDEIQDVDFNSDDDISEFVKCDSNKNKSTRNSKTEESLLSITQAIGEIARAKKNLEMSRKVSKEESINEDSTGWISVNIKNEIKVGKSEMSSRTNNITSNIHCNSATKTRTVKENLDLLNDSDEDFMITEDNAKKFNELESCYFRKSLKDSKDTSCMPSTSRDSEIRNYHFGDILKNLKAKDTCSDNTWKSLKPCGMSTPKNDKRPKLSLKQNKIQQGSDTIDLSFFKAPDKYVSNTKDKNLLKSSSDMSKQSVPLNKKLTRKSTRKLKRKDNARNQFIDDEAEVDSDASSDEIVIDDEDFGDFVSYSQIPQDQVDMHAHYLQTIKSPIKRPGAFHFREPRSSNSDIEIYSQFSSRMQDSYLYVRIGYKLYLSRIGVRIIDLYIYNKLMKYLIFKIGEIRGLERS